MGKKVSCSWISVRPRTDREKRDTETRSLNQELGTPVNEAEAGGGAPVSRLLPG